MLSIIITYHNEGKEFVEECIKQIKETIKIEKYEIIVIDDHSTIPLILDEVKVLRNSKQIGVGKSFDVGVSQSKYENLIIMACDIRFLDNKWAIKLNNHIDNNPESIICTRCIGLRKDSPDTMNIIKRRKVVSKTGATILFFHSHSNNPRKPKGFKRILDAKWLANTPETNLVEIPCILGAIYGVKKDWYNYLDGFALHRYWGCLEPLISLKSWLFGGNCLCAREIETAHIFKTKASHSIPAYEMMSNRILVAKLLFPTAFAQKLIDFLPRNEVVRKAKKVVIDNLEHIRAKKEEYNQKIQLDYRVFCKRWGIKI